MILDPEIHLHEIDCPKLPSKCYCSRVSWIWASLPDRSSPTNSGKWMLFPSADYVDNNWNRVKDLLCDRRIGSCAKVSTAAHANKNFLICIYTDDHNNIPDVFRVLKAVRQSRLSLQSISYKTDDATYQGIYASNSKALPVSKYTSPKVIDKLSLIENVIGPTQKLQKKVVAEEIWTEPVAAVTSSSSAISGMSGMQSGSEKAQSNIIGQKRKASIPTVDSELTAQVSTCNTAAVANVEGRWSCSFCTFLNSPLLPSCELCDTPATISKG